MMRKLRRSRGTSIAELGPTLFMLFIVFAFPLAALASIGVKYIFLLNAAKQAADAGSRCKFWNSGRGPSQNSVVQTVLAMAQKGVSSFSGVTMIGFPQISVFEGDPPEYRPRQLDMRTLPLAAPNTQAVFTLQVGIRAKLDPLIANGGYFVPIPGLNAPIETSAQSSVVLESPTAVTDQN